MMAVVCHGKGDRRFEERPVPALPAPGDAIVRVGMSSICTSDFRHHPDGCVKVAVTPYER